MELENLKEQIMGKDKVYFKNKTGRCTYTIDLEKNNWWFGDNTLFVYWNKRLYSFNIKDVLFKKPLTPTDIKYKRRKEI